MIAVLGSLAPGFSVAIAGSFHVVMVPLKMSEIVFAREIQRVDTLEVEGDSRWAHVGGNLDDVAAAGCLAAALIWSESGRRPVPAKE